MKKIFTVFLFVLSFSGFAQDSTAFLTDTLKLESNWKKGATFGIQFTQSSFYQWVAGGENSYTIAGLSNMFLSYAKNKVKWENTLDANFGLIQQGKNDMIKSDDRFEFNSAIGVKAREKLYYTAQVNFRSQFAPGYQIDNTGRTRISNLLAPAYLTVSLGMEYKPKDGFSWSLSPIAGKTTFVADTLLSNQGLFGVEKGESVRNEFGGLSRVSWKQEVVKNIDFNTNLTLFSNYIENPQNIDVNWDLLVTFKVNKFLNFNVSAVLIYDDDIAVPKDRDNDGVFDGTGKGIQLKEVFALGLSYSFK